jgi:cobalt-zinc-cadmium efflux system outer membrane protein
MQNSHRALLLGVSLALAHTSARAEDNPAPQTPITFEQVLDTVRRQSPDLEAARARIDEAQGHLASATIWPANPELEAAVGPRFGAADSDDDLDWSVGARQRFELGGKRRARIDGATAHAEAASLRAADAERLALHDAATAYVQLLHWQHRSELAQRRIELGEDLARIARRRVELGAAGGIEESLAAVTLLAARAEAAQARAVHAQAQFRLTALLGASAETRFKPRDSLASVALAVDSVASGEAGERADVQALRAQERAAQADVAAARAARVPDVALGANYAREEKQDIVQATIGIEVPLLDRGQGSAAVAAARRQRLRLAAAASERHADAERRAADAAVGILGDAARQIDRAQGELLDRTLAQVRASYEAGDTPLAEVLAVRREVAAAELDHASLLLAAAEARIARITAHANASGSLE